MTELISRKTSRLAPWVFRCTEDISWEAWLRRAGHARAAGCERGLTINASQIYSTQTSEDALQALNELLLLLLLLCCCCWRMLGGGEKHVSQDLGNLLALHVLSI